MKRLRKEMNAFYQEEYDFVMGILKPYSKDNFLEQKDELFTGKRKKIDIMSLPKRLCPAVDKQKQPAKSIGDLQDKLTQLIGKPKLAYKEKLLKQQLKNKLTKKKKQENRNLTKLKKKEEKNETKNELKASPKPIYNDQGQVVFSKFDFSAMGTKTSELRTKTIKDPVVALEKMQRKSQKLKELKEAGETEKVKAIIENKAWKSAILKSKGAKLKDDEELLKKSISKQKKRKEKSAKKWELRANKLKKQQEERQSKRSDNIKLRAKQKKIKKLQKAAKKGKVIAGF